MRSELLGLLLSGSDPLFEGAYIPLEDGLNVFYGLNGAGKSRLLRALQSALSGHASDVECALVVRISAEDCDPELAQIEEPPAGLSPHSALAASLDFYRVDGGDHYAYSALPIEERAPDDGLAEVLLRSFLDAVVGAEGPVAREIRETGLFLFRPVGATSEPAWTAWLVADGRSEQIKAEVERLDRTIDQWADLDEQGASADALEEAWDRYESAVRDSPLFLSDSCYIPSLIPGSSDLSTSPFVPVRVNTLVNDVIQPVLVRGRVDFGIDLVEVGHDVDEATLEHLSCLYVAAATALSKGESALKEWGNAKRLLSPAYRNGLRTAEAVTAVGRASYSSEATTAKEAFRKADALIGRWVEELSAHVESSLRLYLPQPPRATLTVTSHEQRFVDRPVRWRFGSNGLAAVDLSRAEGMWVRVAVALSLVEHLRTTIGVRNGLRRTFLLIDEPEAGLHRAAEALMARALREHASRHGWALFVGTHSPDLLDAPGARTFEIKRSDAGSSVDELDLSERSALAELGLNASDLLRWPRVILLVEGRHDALLLEEFLGDRLRRARVDVLNLRGASRLPATIDSQVLFSHTDAHVVAMLDNLRAENLSAVWQRALHLLRTEGVDAAKGAVIGGLADGAKRSGKEHEFLREWLTRSIDAGLAERVTPFALSESDIIRYLPVQALVPRADSWEALEAKHDEYRLTLKSGSPERDFKQWLMRKYRARFDDDVLLKAAQGAPLPRDFELLMKTLEAIASDVGAKR